MSGLDDTSETLRTVTGTTDTITNNDYDVFYTNSGAKTVTLFAAGAAAVIPGRTFTVINGNTGTVTITPASGTIMGAANYVLAAGTTTAYHGVTFVSDGVSNWVMKNIF